ncbi:hypothetical protein [Candidatus Nitrosoglobus terrae]|nr:hypothetical protein [Candidatus Nitrosoglobus terrae]
MINTINNRPAQTVDFLLLLQKMQNVVVATTAVIMERLDVYQPLTGTCWI